jgi:hypothetical protein
MIFCHPQAKFFHRKIVCDDSIFPSSIGSNKGEVRERRSTESMYIMKDTAAAAAEGVLCDRDSPLLDQTTSAQPCLNQDSFEGSKTSTFVSSIFVGLSFCNNMNIKSADVTPSILDFIYRVNIYDGKKPTMGINVKVCALSVKNNESSFVAHCNPLSASPM